VRVQGLYGAGGKNFFSKLRQLLRDGKTGLRIDDERRVQPTWAGAAARALVAIALGPAADRHGTWHAACQGETTWHRFAERLAARLGLAPSWEAVPSSALTLPAARPRNCLLSDRRLAMYGLPALSSWQDALDDYLRDIEDYEVP
jgi:dTDP-4-dehydrorhamnose reductase